MRHLKAGRKLNRHSSHRKAMFRNMATSLFEHETLKTTLAKAKELRRVAEPLITLAKKDSVANRRLAFSRLRDKGAVQTLFTELGPRFKDRPGGYLSVLKCGFRRGDSAPMALVTLVREKGEIKENLIESNLQNKDSDRIVDAQDEQAINNETASVHQEEKTEMTEATALVEEKAEADEVQTASQEDESPKESASEETLSEEKK